MSEAWAINVDAGSPAYTAQELRRISAMYLFPGVGDRFGAREGVRPHSTDVVTMSGTTWTVHDLDAVVYPGLTSDSGPYVVEFQAIAGSLDPADGSNDRIDALDLQVQDDDEDASGERRVRVVYVAGSPAGSPSAPAVTDNSLRLATILVPSGGSPSPSVQTLAQYTVAVGGILPVRDTSERPTSGLHDGMAVFREDTGAVEVRSNSEWAVAASVHGFQYQEQLGFTSSGTFTKANFPGVRLIHIRCQAAGGGGGGVASTGSGASAVAGGGGGGEFRSGWILTQNLSANETVTVGGGGSGGSDGSDDGTSGEASSFGAHVVAIGGGGGTANNGGTGTNITTAGNGGSGGSYGANVFDTRTQVGEDGHNGYKSNGVVTAGGNGGGSALGSGQRANGTTNGGNGLDGETWGGGGSGAHNNENQGSVRTGGDGAAGIVFVQVFV